MHSVTRNGVPYKMKAILKLKELVAIILQSQTHCKKHILVDSIYTNIPIIGGHIINNSVN